MIIADANLIVSKFLVTEATSAAEEVYRKDGNWRAPRLWRYEVLNALSNLMKAGMISKVKVSEVYNRASAFMQYHEQDALPERVIDLVDNHKLTAYDAQYAALAIENHCPVYTRDKGILATIPEYAEKY